MWYFAWILGVGCAIGFALLVGIWFESGTATDN